MSQTGRLIAAGAATVLGAVAALGAAAAPGGQAQADWTLAFEDNFERNAVGADWTGPKNTLSVKDGKLVITGDGGMWALCTRRFAGDVKVEYSGTSIPARQACDITTLLCANQYRGFGTGYFLGFGSDLNTRNKLIRAGRQVTSSNDYLITPGKAHHIVAQKLGDRITLTVDGHRLIDHRDPEPIGGPGVDQIGFYVWNSQVEIDDVKVYTTGEVESRPPADALALPIVRRDRKLVTTRADAPEALARGVAALNRNDLKRASAAFEALPNSIERAAGFAWLAGHLDNENPGPAIQAILATLNAVPKSGRTDALRTLTRRLARVVDRTAAPGDRQADIYRILAWVGPEHPYYYAALLQYGRFLHWEWLDEHDPRTKDGRDAVFAELAAAFPDNRIIRQYTGNPVPWGQELTTPPLWASHLREGLVRSLQVLEWWYHHRQAENGSLGGEWADDVEVLRSWSNIAAVSPNASVDAYATIRRLADGVWHHAGLLNGYFNVMGNVQYSSQPTSDSQPQMALLEYGDPVYIERLMQIVKTMRDLHMGRTKRGHLHWRSTRLSGSAVDDDARTAVDVPYASRAWKPAVWLAWYNRSTDATTIVTDYAKAWAEDAMRAEGGKPRGVVPAYVVFDSGELTRPDCPWWDPKLAWPYYQWDGDVSEGRILDVLATGHHFTPDPLLLEPIRTAMKYRLGPQVPPDARPKPGTDEWIRWSIQRHEWLLNAALVAVRFDAGLTEYDDYLAEHAGDYINFLLTGDFARIERLAANAGQALRANFAMLTNEPTATRAMTLYGSTELLHCYTGAVREWDDAGYPTLSVSWSTPTRDFAAVVTRPGRRRLDLLLYNFRSQSIRLGMHVWRLVPGRYRLRQGPDFDEDRRRDRVSEDREVRIAHRGDPVYLAVPPKLIQVISLELIPGGETPLKWPIPDLALSPGELRLAYARDPKRVEIVVHNIGSAQAPGATLSAVALVGDEERPLDRQAVPPLDAPNDLTPRTAKVALDLSHAPPRCTLRFTLTPRAQTYEITEQNNVVTIPAGGS